MAERPQSRRALAGLRVLELGDPKVHYCGKLLRELGYSDEAILHLRQKGAVA